ncbi:MAG TPA: flippase [Planctomycetota bacterium]|nr:flippase [Planctomycetota bacterium]
MSVERATRNVGWVFGLYLVRSALRLGYFVSFARKLEQMGFGSYYFLLAPVTILSITSALGLNVYLIRQINRGITDVRRFISRCFGLDLTSSLIFTMGLLIVAPFTPYTEEVRLGMAIMGLAVVPMALIGMMHSVGTACETLWPYAVLANATPLAEAGIGIVLLFNGFGLISLCILHTAVYWVFAIVFFILTRVHIVRFGFHFRLRAWLGYLKTSWQVGVFAVQAVLYAHLGVIILSVMTGNRQVGLFGAAMTLVEALREAANAFRAAVFPYMVRAWHRDPEELKRFNESCVRLLAAVTVPIGLLGVLLAGPVIRLLFQQKFAGSIPVLQVLSWLVFPLFMEAILVRVCHASGHARLPILGHTVINVTRIALSVVLVTTFADDAAVGLAWAMLISGVAGFVVYTLLIRRYIYRFSPVEALARTAAGAVVPVALVVLLSGRVNPFLLAVMVVVTSVAGVFLFRMFTAREFEIFRRVLLSFAGRKPEVVDSAVKTLDDTEL